MIRDGLLSKFRMRSFWFVLAFLLLPAADLLAADNSGFQALPPPPPMPTKVEPAPPPAQSTDRVPAPEITITTHGQTRYQEYRIGGQLYMIKVIPAKGPPYYLIDRNGTGRFSRSDFAPRVSPPMWILKRF